MQENIKLLNKMKKTPEIVINLRINIVKVKLNNKQHGKD